jgi:hydroxymethylglutaryl-CoA lyase
MKIIECPRDAMQGLERFISTEIKIQYINKLLQAGFDTIDFGSFVSAKAIPQMADTAQVLEKLDLTGSTSKLLVIVANQRGAEQAVNYPDITYLGFPLSISETFQIRNTNKTIPEALNTLEEIKNLCDKSGKKLVTYISMGFGNPYGDPFEVNLVSQFAEILLALGSDIISLADTIGIAEPPLIRSLFSSVSKQFPLAEIGVHLHSTPATAREKVNAAFEGGCKRFDGALRGFGGCPMAKDELVGNLATEVIVSFFDDQEISLKLNREAFGESLSLADKVFNVEEQR